MIAESIVLVMLEAGDDDLDPKSEIGRYTSTMEFDQGAAHILRDARELYLRLVKDGTIDALQKADTGRPGTLKYDASALAQAIIRRAIERRESPGAKNAYRNLKRLNYFNF